MTNKKYNVIISDRAATLLVNHVKFLAKVSPDAAAKLQKEIISEVRALEIMPESYPWLNCTEIPANKYRKKLAAKRYLIICQIKEDDVFVEYVLDCRQNYNWLL